MHLVSRGGLAGKQNGHLISQEQLLWRIEWVFTPDRVRALNSGLAAAVDAAAAAAAHPQTTLAALGAVMVADGRVDEQLTLRMAVARHIGPAGAAAADRAGAMNSGSGAVRRLWQLRSYRGLPSADLQFYLRQEAGLGGAAEGYWPLDAEKSLKENLVGKLVVEYPVIHVALAADCGHYDAAPAVEGGGNLVALVGAEDDEESSQEETSSSSSEDEEEDDDEEGTSEEEQSTSDDEGIDTAKFPSAADSCDELRPDELKNRGTSSAHSGCGGGGGIAAAQAIVSHFMIPPGNMGIISQLHTNAQV